MSTRGVFGLVIDGEVKDTIIAHDAYPGSMIPTIVEGFRECVFRFGRNALPDMARKVRMITNPRENPPTEEIDRLINFSLDWRGDDSVLTWSSLTANIRGDLFLHLKHQIMIPSDSLTGYSFMHDSLFCEWGYLFNFDTQVLEVYKGSQKEPHDRGRYAAGKPETEGYYPCALIEEIPFDNLMTDEFDRSWTRYLPLGFDKDEGNPFYLPRLYYILAFQNGQMVGHVFGAPMAQYIEDEPGSTPMAYRFDQIEAIMDNLRETSEYEFQVFKLSARRQGQYREYEE